MTQESFPQESFPTETICVRTGCGTMYIFIATKDGKPHKIFAQLGKSGGCARAQLEAFVDMASILICELPDHPATTMALTKASGHQCFYGVESCINVLSRTLLDYIVDIKNHGQPRPSQEDDHFIEEE